MNTYTTDQLLSFKLLIAEYCKDRIYCKSYNGFCYDDGKEILDTEWAQIVNDVELGLPKEMRMKCCNALCTLQHPSNNWYDEALVAPWPQRVDAMQRAEVFERKGI